MLDFKMLNSDMIMSYLLRGKKKVNVILAQLYQLSAFL